jgi:hypothetical protein
VSAYDLRQPVTSLKPGGGTGDPRGCLAELARARRAVVILRDLVPEEEESPAADIDGALARLYARVVPRALRTFVGAPEALDPDD